MCVTHQCARYCIPILVRTQCAAFGVCGRTLVQRARRIHLGRRLCGRETPTRQMTSGETGQGCERVQSASERGKAASINSVCAACARTAIMMAKYEYEARVCTVHTRCATVLAVCLLCTNKAGTMGARARAQTKGPGPVWSVQRNGTSGVRGPTFSVRAQTQRCANIGCDGSDARA